MYYFNARWYDPGLGRFISEDPARDGGNWFAYCYNNPLNRIDPSGLESPSPLMNWLLPKVDSFIKKGEQGGWDLQKYGPLGFIVGGAQGLLYTAADILIPDTGDELVEYVGLAQSCNIGGFVSNIGRKLETTAATKGALALPEVVAPRGFKNANQFKDAMAELDQVLIKNGIDDAAIRIRGTAATGNSKNPNKIGKFFDSSSDVDLSIQSSKLADSLRGSGQTTSKNVPGLFLPEKIAKANPTLFSGLSSWSSKWSKTIGHEIMPAASDPALVQNDLTDVFYKAGK